jgi:hypothetical protein
MRALVLIATFSTAARFLGMRILPPLIATLLVAAAPAAAAPWSAPGTFPTSIGNSPVLALGATGPQAVFWNNYTGGIVNGLPGPGGQISTSVSTLGAGLVPTPPQTVTPAFSIAGFGNVATAAFGGADVALPDAVIGVATGPVTGPLAVHKLPAPVRGIATNAAGDIAVVIEPCATNNSGCHPAAPSVVLERRGHRFGKPIAVGSKGHGYGAAIAIDPHGRALVVWDRNKGVYARFVATNGKLGPAQRLGTATTFTNFQAVLPGDGRAAVGWTSQDVSEGDATSSFTAHLALAGAGGRFVRARLLETIALTGTGLYVPYQGLAVTLPAGQPGVAAWTGNSGGHYVVRAAPLVGTSVGVSRVVSQPGVDTILAAAAEGSRGEAAILVLPGRAGDNGPLPGSTDGLDAVTRASPSEPFGPTEQVVPGPVYIDGAELGIDAASGGAFATWRDVDGPVGWSVRTSIG